MSNTITQVIGITPKELKEDFINDVRDELNALARNFQSIEPQEYLTRKEVSEILKVSLVTLHSWNKKKILNPYRLGNIIRYKLTEIEIKFIRINDK